MYGPGLSEWICKGQIITCQTFKNKIGYKTFTSVLPSWYWCLPNCQHRGEFHSQLYQFQMFFPVIPCPSTHSSMNKTMLPQVGFVKRNRCQNHLQHSQTKAVGSMSSLNMQGEVLIVLSLLLYRLLTRKMNQM